MFNGGNSVMPFTMPVEPANSGNNNNNGWGGDGAWLIWIVLIFAMFGWGGNGFGGFGGNGAGLNGVLTRADLCADMNFQSLENAVGRLSDNQALQFTQLNNGMCNLGYQNAQLINGVQMQVANEFRGVDNAICNLGYNTQQGFNQTNIALMQGQNALSTQLADCCCKTQSGMKDIQFQNAQDTCAITNSMQNTARDIIDNNNCNTRSILDFLVQDKISTLQAENQNLKLAASQAAQNNYLISELKPCPQPAYITCNPFTGQYGGYGYNGYGNGCGCGNNNSCGCC